MMMGMYNGGDMRYNMFARGERAGGKTMKKFGKLIFILCLVAVLAVTVAACNEKDEENGGGGGTLYGITMPSSDIYAIGGEVPEDATEGTTITFTVTLNDPENSAILGVTVEPTFDASYDIASNNGTYSFVMPASPVKIIIDARAYAEVLSDGGLTFMTSNPTTITVNGGNDMTWGGPNGTQLINVWEFGLAFVWGNTSNLSSRSYVTSSNEDVIPADAISDIKEGSKSSGGTISSASFYIDPAKINPGTTWLEIYLKSNNTSSAGTLFVKITVLPEGGSVEVETWTETIVFDIASGIDMDEVNFTVTDNDYASNTGTEERQQFMPGEYTYEDGEVSIEIEYVVGHEYSVSVGIGNTGNSYELGEGVSSGGSYQDGILTFSREGASVTIIVYNEIWQP